MIKLVIVCGKQGAGKDAVTDAIVAQSPDIFKRKIAYTTRASRPFEVNGIHYHFISDEEFFNKLLDGSIIEATDINGDMYGTGIENLSNEHINIGALDPAGIEILTHDKNIDMLVFYLDVPEHVRIIRVLKQNRGYTIPQIYDRYMFDEKAFKWLEKCGRVTTFKNDDDTDIETLSLVMATVAKNYFKI